ncbi:o-methyltransferas-like protein [Pseudovirgaria hyperparasitica]|uniref:O-methyltransferas-like protein n=1 Tax=Pseudovirgaria hyperparasitica TaxID=470096 RepID=A0A6A6WN37_9PEZI|nr:o-methyltransferas-like protein [Pseudovirgaria hyperparasitica]KAF2763496.1 o-methyltransferas-like protein [Pseudovirgaria hyperparasitica]
MSSQLITAAEELLALAKQDQNKQYIHTATLEVADKFRCLCETPLDIVLRQWKSSHLTAAIDVLKSLKVFENMPESDSITASELAQKSNVDASVITRCMRMLCVEGIAHETEPGVFLHNEKSLAFMSDSPIAAFFEMVLDQDMVLRKLPEYFATHTIADFFDLKKSPWVYALGHEGRPFYEVLAADPVRAKRFDVVMGQADKLFDIRGTYPFAGAKAGIEAEPDRAFIVDVGGGNGTTLKTIQQEAPDGFGAAMVLQDRPDVLAAIDENDVPGVTKMEQDIFAPQKVKNAHLYLIRRVLHNFYPETCVKILENIASAMGPTSRLLVCDAVLADRTQVGENAMTCFMDMSMMVMTGREKTAREFREIASAAGLEVVKFWPDQAGAQVVIEMRLKD